MLKFLFYAYKMNLLYSFEIPLDVYLIIVTPI